MIVIFTQKLYFEIKLQTESNRLESGRRHTHVHTRINILHEKMKFKINIPNDWKQSKEKKKWKKNKYAYGCFFSTDFIIIIY